MPSKEQVLEELKKVKYPGFSRDIVSMGAVAEVEAAPDSVTVALKEISADEGTIGRLIREITAAVKEIAPGAEVHVLPGGAPARPKAPQGQSPFRRKSIPGVRKIIPVTSGKGGVGKSTVAVNLAYTLSRLGNKVGVLDLDVFGPSVHKMLGAKGPLEVEGEKILPAEARGLKIISIGMAVGDDEAMVLRGPMVMKLLDQLMGQVKWDELDYLVVDLPPGTGDVPLSLVQQLAIDGAVVVTTPQDIALIDVRRAIAMFRQTETNILGIVENMSYYKCEKCGDVAHIFGQGGGAAEAEKLGVPLLGQIPLVKSICEEADAGSPIFDREKNPELAEVFESLARNVAREAESAPSPGAGPLQSVSFAAGDGG